MCNSCRQTRAYVKVNDNIIAEVTYDTYEYDEYAEYTQAELDERIELKVNSLWMTRKALQENIQEIYL